jgi:hypothetical protein
MDQNKINRALRVIFFITVSIKALFEIIYAL